MADRTSDITGERFVRIPYIGDASYGRILRWVVAAAVAFGTLHLLWDIRFALSQWWGQLSLPYAVNSWSDGPLLVQVDRILRGYLPYTPVYGADSFTYGPSYLYLLALFFRPFGSVAAIVPLRLISTGMALAACVPIVFALAALRRARAEATSVYAAPLAIAFTLALYLLIDGRDPTFLSLHPNALSELTIATSIAAFLWYPLVARKRLVLGVLLLSAFVEALAKLNAAPQVAFFLAALVIERALTIRKAALALAGFVAAFALLYLILPAPERTWTLVIPLHHWFREPMWGVVWLQNDWLHQLPWAGVLTLATLAVLVADFASGRRRAALAYATILAGLFVTGYAALIKIGGGSYDVWWFYLACAIRCGAFLESTLRRSGNLRADALAASAGTVAFALVLPVVFMRGWYNTTALSARARADLAGTKVAVAALCRPHYHIMVTWFPDPLLRCPGATFQLWDSVEEVTWARPRGYGARIVLDNPVSPDAFVMFREAWLMSGQSKSVFPLQLAGDYRIATYPVYFPIAYGFVPMHLDVFMKKSSYPASGQARLPAKR